MKTYILFIFGMFEDHEDVQFFCTEILGTSEVIDSVRYVIENSQNIIVIAQHIFHTIFMIFQHNSKYCWNAQL